MAGWEYKISELNISEKWGSKRQAKEVERFMEHLNEMGSDNWEMVSYESIPLTGSFSGNVKGYAYLCFFKRPKA
ncbi:MAG: DUF4177 domain-containing protein [Actinobacteria bacterium]|nr:DUF4177 domain-containing protein [Actinomycetota bacterium]